MPDQEFQTSNQDNEAQIVTTLLTQYQSMAAQLVASETLIAAKAALEPIQSQDTTIQSAFLKSLAQEKTVDAANIEQAIQTLSPDKEVRKEARRRLIQLEASDIYPTWTPDLMQMTSRSLEELAQDSQVPAEAEALLSELENLFGAANEVSGESDFTTIVEDFLESWHNEDFADAYSCLSEASTVKEGLAQDDWIARREDWTRTVTPNDMQIMFFHANTEEQAGDAQPRTFVDVGVSIELTKPQPLAEWPQSTISLAETGRHWYWLRYTVIQEDDNWLIQTITDEARTITALPVEELVQRIQTNEVELQEISKRVAEEELEDEIEDEEELEDEIEELVDLIEATNDLNEDSKVVEAEVVEVDLTEDEDEDDEDDEDIEGVTTLLDNSLDDMDTMVRLVIQSLHDYDAIFAQDPVKYAQYYKDAFNLARTIHDIERAIVYVQQATKHASTERSEAFLNLAMSYQALATRFHEDDDHEREERFEDLVEPAIRQSVAIDENPTNLTMLATVLVINDGDIHEAEALFVKAQKGPLTPELSVNIETGLGEIAIVNEEYAKALKHFQELSKLAPEEAHIWYRLGYIHHQLDHINEAIKALRQSAELDPELTEAYTELAGIYTTQGNTKLAREIVQTGLDENPEAADLYATMALIYIHTKDLASANRQLIKAESLDSDDDFVQEARQRYNQEIKQRPAQPKSQQKHKQHKAKKR